MWNYGKNKPLTMDQMKFQLDRYYHWLKKKNIEGIIFCSNCIADIGLGDRGIYTSMDSRSQ